jgi:predicted dehydrogenase
MLEKPIAPTPEECAAITKAANERGVKVLICHVLRFTPFYGRLKQLIMEGYVGDVQVVEQVEHVGLMHQSHSFVRGNWGNEGRSSSMLLQKSCHDIDIIQWLIDKPCKQVSSFGSLEYFTEKNAPEGAPERCIDGCPAAETCPFHTDKLYLHPTGSFGGWFRNAATKMLRSTDEAVLEALKTTNYGRCVFRCDNDVVDRQVVNMQFEGGVVASFTMAAFNGWGGGRAIRVMGTKGMLRASTSDKEIFYDNAVTGTTEMIPVDVGTGATIVDGHGGGDRGIMNVFGKLVAGEYHGVAAATIATSCDNHMIVFAAEESRKEGTVVSVPEFAARYGI